MTFRSMYGDLQGIFSSYIFSLPIFLSAIFTCGHGVAKEKNFNPPPFFFALVKNRKFKRSFFGFFSFFFLFFYIND